jgi:hypothetical protein
MISLKQFTPRFTPAFAGALSFFGFAKGGKGFACSGAANFAHLLHALVVRLALDRQVQVTIVSFARNRFKPYRRGAKITPISAYD